MGGDAWDPAVPGRARLDHMGGRNPGHRRGRMRDGRDRGASLEASERGVVLRVGRRGSVLALEPDQGGDRARAPRRSPSPRGEWAVVPQRSRDRGRRHLGRGRACPRTWSLSADASRAGRRGGRIRRRRRMLTGAARRTLDVGRRRRAHPRVDLVRRVRRGVRWPGAPARGAGRSGHDGAGRRGPRARDPSTR
jgi:hypothetical protein